MPSFQKLIKSELCFENGSMHEDDQNLGEKKTISLLMASKKWNVAKTEKVCFCCKHSQKNIFLLFFERNRKKEVALKDQ